ncbi:hypothetical protein [Arthrobacter sp. ISL-5]|uniref:hypothetical protein n=1 Tax=Arthrobacter sp. ISL-5 TaxID=2819111 RepID=UPI001BE7AAB7|nr:hypothetical protein [Arthrobacter sp. ISL-5]MBT2552701.1 hypothetical protein [Arthrobacter sp. ISL-5]
MVRFSATVQQRGPNPFLDVPGSVTVELLPFASHGRIRVTGRLVQQMPGEVMTWSLGLPLGLLKRVRTFTLSPQAGLTHLIGLPGNTRPDTAHTLIDYINAVTNRAELLDRAS